MLRPASGLSFIRGPHSPFGGITKTRIRDSPSMGDREVDQQLVERAQRGDKRAYELLVLKYQRKLGRLWLRQSSSFST